METDRHLDIHEHNIYRQRLRPFAILLLQPTTVAGFLLPATALLQDRERFETLVCDGDGALRSLQLLDEHALVDQVVFDKEHMNTLARLQHRRSDSLAGSGGLLDRDVHCFGLEVEAKHRAFALFRGNPDSSALLLGELAADVQAETATAVRDVRFRRCLGEALEQALDLCRRESGSGILHQEVDVDLLFIRLRVQQCCVWFGGIGSRNPLQIAKWG